ncbi:MAG: hypothetical protein RLO50_22520 [Azospirillaceae bacterium]
MTERLERGAADRACFRGTVRAHALSLAATGGFAAVMILLAAMGEDTGGLPVGRIAMFGLALIALAGFAIILIGIVLRRHELCIDRQGLAAFATPMAPGRIAWKEIVAVQVRRALPFPVILERIGDSLPIARHGPICVRLDLAEGAVLGQEQPIFCQAFWSLRARLLRSRHRVTIPVGVAAAEAPALEEALRRYGPDNLPVTVENRLTAAPPPSS